jgi:hypothetical protein
MNPDYILLRGIKDPQRLERHFATYLVDIAYAESLGSDRVRIAVESATNLRNEEDTNWIMGAVIGALRATGEDEFTTEIVLVP